MARLRLGLSEAHKDMTRRTIAPFLGVVTSLDSTVIGESNASDALNVRLEDGSIRPRFGFHNLQEKMSMFVSAHGMEYIQGYDANNMFVFEYITFERKSSDAEGKCQPYSRNPITGAPSVIKNGTASLALDATSEWRGFAWGHTSYFTNSAEGTVYRHTIGDAASFSPLRMPDAPENAPTISFTIPPYALLSFGNGSTGVHMTNDVVYTGAAKAAGSTQNSDGSITIDHTAGQTTNSSFEVTLNGAGASVPGLQDWEYNDVFAFILDAPQNSSFRIDPATVSISYTNEAGTAIAADDITFDSLLSVGKMTYFVRAAFNIKARSMWTGSNKIRKIRVAYKVSGSGVSNNKLTLRTPTIGGVWMRGKASKVRFGYSHYNLADDLESPMSPTVDIFAGELEGSSFYETLKGLGVHLQIASLESSDASVTHNNFYVYDYETKDEEHPIIRRIASQADSTLTLAYRLTTREMQGLDEMAGPRPFPYKDLFAGIPYKGGAVWLKRGGGANLMFSRVGDPLKMADTRDSLDDVNRGETFTLGDNFADEPLNAHQCDDALLITSLNGVHAMIGNRPSEMTPPKKLPGSFGAASWKASTRWQDPHGNPGVVVLSEDGEGIYFYQVTSSFDGVQGFNAVELSEHIRPSLRSFLGSGSTDFTNAICVVEPKTDALWVINGKRALVLRRPNLVSGRREWEFHEFNMPGSVIARANADAIRRMKWLRSTGEFDENEYRFGTNSYVMGWGSDGGLPIESIYWKSKGFYGERRRVLWVKAEKEQAQDSITITVETDGVSKSYVCGAQRDIIKTDVSQVGEAAFVTISIPETCAGVDRVVIYESVPVGDRRFVS